MPIKAVKMPLSMGMTYPDPTTDSVKGKEQTVTKNTVPLHAVRASLKHRTTVWFYHDCNDDDIWSIVPGMNHPLDFELIDNDRPLH